MIEAAYVEIFGVGTELENTDMAWRIKGRSGGGVSSSAGKLAVVSFSISDVGEGGRLRG